MAKPSLQFTFLFLLLLSCSGENVKLVQCQKTWCVARPSTDDAALKENIEFACSMVNCGIIQSGGPCFNPDTSMSHASVAMNLYYKSRGMNSWNCDFSGSGLIVAADPSYSSCTYA
ncbi:major pollen allergen Ole e 10-like [Ananas comosus]|uniref:Major pollen allergen Ole e 10-like n=1 Tax=Ananas comosus TaxID=4615 RepID=A0A6P5G9N0_ANACO|nr:major pollen allergen Ole e 10-like [Ananas comosus]